jgi:hypothetical protein
MISPHAADDSLYATELPVVVLVVVVRVADAVAP